jgi:Fe-S-cluster-containing hydrogenase component 2
MTEKEKESREISRREFLRDAGLLVGGTAIGSTIFLAACAGEPETATVTQTQMATTTATQTQMATTTKTATVEISKEIPKSGYIEWDPDKCLYCGRCLMVCAAYHEGAMAPQLSAIKWHETDYLAGLPHRKPLFCQQCSQPECYSICTLDAIEIDNTTGARYVNKEKCNGCGLCVQACPYEEKRISIDQENMVAIKCDLCKDRPGGPVCVELCNAKALTFISKEGRI